MLLKNLRAGERILIPMYLVTDQHPYGAARSWVEASVSERHGSQTDYPERGILCTLAGGGHVVVPYGTLPKCIRLADVESMNAFEVVENGGA